MLLPEQTKIRVLTVAVAVLFAYGCGLSKAEFESRFAKVDDGQTRADVIRSLGEPTEVEPCTDAQHSFYQKKGLTCGEKLRYLKFLEVWTVVLDADDKAVSKYNQVSP
jgi:hypothetical protein